MEILMGTKTLLTVDDFLRLPEPPDAHYELVDGELITVSPGMFRHNRVRDRIFFILELFLRETKLGTAVAEQSFHLFGDTVRVPDVAFVSSGRTLPMDKLPEGAPDVAIEVVSPSNTPREIDQRISDYFAGGSRRVWLVYPEHAEVYVHGLAGVTRRQGDDLIEDAELLPGFSVKAASTFA
jgi:Uma2 family endonuclease